MMQDLRIVAFFVLVAACVATAGCAGNQGNGAATPITPAQTLQGTGSPPIDLTNQDSPQAATFRNGASYTPLETPRPDIRLEKIAAGFSAPMMMTMPDDGSGRIAVVDQIGM
jgi:hypothetical protein